MTSDLKNVSMNGRMAYIIMCIESYLATRYPERDWSILSGILWLATEINWVAWSNLYVAYIPSIFFDYKGYDEELAECFPIETYQHLKRLYAGLTDGSIEETDPSDELNYILNLPFELAMIYEGMSVGDGAYSFESIEETENILKQNDIALPDYRKVLFSHVSEFNGWGNDFNGRYLSIILPKSKETIIETDQTEYHIILKPNLSWDQLAVRAVNITAEKKLRCVDAEKCLTKGGHIISSKAPIIRNAAWELQAAGVAFTITPAFPYHI